MSFACTLPRDAEPIHEKETDLRIPAEQIQEKVDEIRRLEVQSEGLLQERMELDGQRQKVMVSLYDNEYRISDLKKEISKLVSAGPSPDIVEKWRRDDPYYKENKKSL